MKLRLALATMIIGITAAVLARPAAPAALPASGPDLPALLAPAVTTGHPAAAAWPGTAANQWDLPAPTPPPGLQPERWPASPPLPGDATGTEPLPAAPALETADTLLGDPGLFRADPAPEPQAWMLMLAGFALVGLAARRRHLATL